MEDTTVHPLGFRIRVNQDALGKDRARALALGTAHLFCNLKDFGAQTQLWMNDLLALARKAGWDIVHRPFNGRTLPRIQSR